MVLYSYECENCKFQEERWFPMGRATKSVKCKKCGKKSVRVFGCSVQVPDPVSDARINRGTG